MSEQTYERTATQTCPWTDLPAALHGLWDTCLQSGDGSDVGRALTINLLAIAEADRLDALRDMNEQLFRHTPCRAFVLLLDDTATGKTAELSATTRRKRVLRDIVLEEIVLRLRPEDLPLVPGLLRPLIIDDLPGHLFWTLPWPAQEETFDTLTQLTQHAIVDSRHFGNPARELPILTKRQQAGQRITDLSWLRVQPWRRALAEAFERFTWQPNTPVKGMVRHGKTARATALLLSDWLHERLRASIVLEPDGQPDSIGPDQVKLEIALPTGTIEITIDMEQDQLVTHVTTPSHCYVPFRASARRGTDTKLLSLSIDAG